MSKSPSKAILMHSGRCMCHGMLGMNLYLGFEQQNPITILITVLCINLSVGWYIPVRKVYPNTPIVFIAIKNMIAPWFVVRDYRNYMRAKAATKRR